MTCAGHVARMGKKRNAYNEYNACIGRKARRKEAAKKN
jgi:hypothetical protein